VSFELFFAALERGLTETDDTVDSLIVGAVSDILYINTVFSGTISGKAFIEYLF
jgi:hypothetical protein